MLEQLKKYKAIVAIVIVFCVGLGLLITDTIKFNKSYYGDEEQDTIYVTKYVEVDTLETIEIDSTSELINSDAVD